MEYRQVTLFGGAKWEISVTYKVKDIPQNIHGFSFVAHFLTAKGGDIILSVSPEILSESEGSFKISATKAQASSLLHAKWFELYVTISPGDDPLKWIDIPVVFNPGGK